MEAVEPAPCPLLLPSPLKASAPTAALMASLRADLLTLKAAGERLDLIATTPSGRCPPSNTASMLTSPSISSISQIKACLLYRVLAAAGPRSLARRTIHVR